MTMVEAIERMRVLSERMDRIQEERYERMKSEIVYLRMGIKLLKSLARDERTAQRAQLMLDNTKHYD